MSSIRYALLSLLAREPLSGYDIKLQMNGRIGPFWKVGSNQVYPELSKMEAEGLVKLQGVEQHTYRPARKLYEVTEAGKEALIRWTVEPGGVENVRDDFLLKAYNAWLVEPEKMKVQVEEIRKLHEERLAAYEEKVEELKRIADPGKTDDPIASSISVVEFGVEYERLYIRWCDNFLKKL
ncbi:PadR family transcriptional regulator [Cohnella candidum]|uniref:PadR family transcriptional regulator n=1 Tax=Cohnella candidum TaxID=2674991 RepID=A0A3G3K355_9BACL|nr:PadR family transcriptional regulator [Cohnella candidum]AYQ74985.1 PadR family transcriptional regulator [Cohnella candidum]